LPTKKQGGRQDAFKTDFLQDYALEFNLAKTTPKIRRNPLFLQSVIKTFQIYYIVIIRYLPIKNDLSK